MNGLGRETINLDGDCVPRAVLYSFITRSFLSLRVRNSFRLVSRVLQFVRSGVASGIERHQVSGTNCYARSSDDDLLYSRVEIFVVKQCL